MHVANHIPGAATKAAIKQLAYGLGVNQTAPNQTCPVCKSGEKSFSVTRLSTGIIYNCFRAKCRARGMLPMLGADAAATTEKKAFTPNYLVYPLRNFSDAEVSLYFDKYELSATLVRDNGFRFEHTNGRIAMPIMDVDGRKYGMSCKTTPDTTWKGPKSVEYWDKEYIKLHFPKYVDSIPGWCCVTEDILSAVKVSQITECVALLGTSMSLDAAVVLSKSYNNLLVMLDPGAEEAAHEIVRKYKLYFSNIKVLTLQKDPKDTPYEELKGAILGTINPGSNALKQEGV